MIKKERNAAGQEKQKENGKSERRQPYKRKVRLY
jgi:hypothetical protein